MLSRQIGYIKTKLPIRKDRQFLYGGKLQFIVLLERVARASLA